MGIPHALHRSLSDRQPGSAEGACRERRAHCLSVRRIRPRRVRSPCSLRVALHPAECSFAALDQPRLNRKGPGQCRRVDGSARRPRGNHQTQTEQHDTRFFVQISLHRSTVLIALRGGRWALVCGRRLPLNSRRVLRFCGAPSPALTGTLERPQSQLRQTRLVALSL